MLPPLLERESGKGAKQEILLLIHDKFLSDFGKTGKLVIELLSQPKV